MRKTKTSLILFNLLIFLFLVSCSKSDNSNIDNESITGTWKLRSPIYINGVVFIEKYNVEFLKDKALVSCKFVSSNEVESVASYDIKNNNVFIVFEGGQSVVYNYLNGILTAKADGLTIELVKVD